MFLFQNKIQTCTNLLNKIMTTQEECSEYDFIAGLHSGIVNTEIPEGICSDTFALDNFLRLFLHPSIFESKIQDESK